MVVAWLAAFRAALEREQARWFLWLPVMVGTGIALYFLLPSEPHPAIAAGLLALAMLLRAVGGGGTLRTLASAAVLACAAGFALAQTRAIIVAAPVISGDSRVYRITGWVELVEPRPDRSHRLTLRIHAIEGLAVGETPTRVRISVLQSGLPLRAGDGVRLAARLGAPSEPAEPGGYDPRRLAYFQQVGALGFAVSPVEQAAIEAPAPWSVRWRAKFNRLREDIAARIRASLAGETGAIAVALITGERGGITAATNAAYRDSGLVHVLSISGLHMTIMAGSVYFVVRLLLSLVPPFALRFDIRRWAAVAGGIGALGYLLISGAALPTIRAFLMVIIMFTAILLGRPALALRNVALAALVILIAIPESLVDVSFQMSFAAVVALIAGYEAWRDWRHGGGEAAPRRGSMLPIAFLAGIVGSTLLASAAVAPFGIYHFHHSQQYAVLANLIAIPVVNIVIMPAALAVLVMLPLSLEAWPLVPMGLGIDAMTWVAYTVAGLPGAVVHVPAIPALSFGLMIAGGLWALLWRGRIRLAGLAVLIGGIAMTPFGERPDVLVAPDGASLAVRDATGGLTVPPGAASTYSLGRWLERDGTPASRSAGRRGGGAQSPFRCDELGCIAEVKGRTLAIVRHAAALREDCSRADIVIVPKTTASRCQDRLVIDREALQRGGAHALTIGPGGMKIATVRREGEGRPWSVVRSSALTRERWAGSELAGPRFGYRRQRKPLKRPDATSRSIEIRDEAP